MQALDHAVNVNGMPACRHMRRFDGMEQIFQADGAVGVKPIRFTHVIQRYNARAAIVAMHEIIIAHDTTNAAFIAVIILSLNAVIKKVAHGTKIGGKLDAAFMIYACVGHGLPVITCGAYHLFDRVPIHIMGLAVIVAVAAPICLVAARRN
jgi:hypothetical protein